METIIEITITSSFENDQHYVLQEISDPEDKTKYQIVSKEFGRLVGKPGLNKTTYEIDATTVENMIKELMNTPISVCPPFACGLDGTTTEVKIMRGFNSVQFKWWGNIPKQWKNLKSLNKFFKKKRKSHK